MLTGKIPFFFLQKCCDNFNLCKIKCFKKLNVFEIMNINACGIFYVNNNYIRCGLNIITYLTYCILSVIYIRLRLKPSL